MCTKPRTTARFTVPSRENNVQPAVCEPRGGARQSEQAVAHAGASSPDACEASALLDATALRRAAPLCRWWRSSSASTAKGAARAAGGVHPLCGLQLTLLVLRHHVGERAGCCRAIGNGCGAGGVGTRNGRGVRDADRWPSRCCSRILRSWCACCAAKRARLGMACAWKLKRTGPLTWQNLPICGSSFAAWRPVRSRLPWTGSCLQAVWSAHAACQFRAA